VVFACATVEGDYIQPAVLMTCGCRGTWPTSITPARMVMQQEVKTRDVVLFRALVHIVDIAGVR